MGSSSAVTLAFHVVQSHTVSARNQEKRKSLDITAGLVYMLNIMTSGLLPSRFLTYALTLLLLSHSSVAADNWIEVRSPRFTVQPNAGEKEAQRVADQIEKRRSRI